MRFPNQNPDLDAIEESGIYQRTPEGRLDCLICKVRLISPYEPVISEHEHTPEHRAAQARIAARHVSEDQLLRLRAHIYRAKTQAVTHLDSIGEINAYNHCLQLLLTLEFSTGGPDPLNPPTDRILKDMREKIAAFRQEANMSAKPQAADAFSSMLQLIDEQTERLFSFTWANHKDKLRHELEKLITDQSAIREDPTHGSVYKFTDLDKLLDGIMSIIEGESNEN